MSVSGNGCGDNSGSAAPAKTTAQRGFELDIVHEAGDWSGFSPIEPTIEAAAAALAGLAQLPRADGQACIVLSSDNGVRKLNAAWRKKDKPTNVLSFPAPAAPSDLAGDAPRFLGDIVLAAETLQKEAEAEGIPPRHHLQHLVIHGLMHLLGYDHETNGDAEVMEAHEVAALAAIGVANPYDAGEPLT